MLQSQLMNLQTAYPVVAKAPVVSAIANKQAVIYKVECTNGTAGSLGVGIMKSLGSGEYDFYEVTDASSPKAVLNNNVKGAGTSRLFSTTANDGFLVQSRDRVGFLGFTTHNSSAAIGTITVKYFNGVAYTSVTPIAVPSGLTPAGYFVFFLQVPHDWVPGTTAAVGGDSSMYSLLVTMGAGLTTEVGVDAMIVGQILSYNKAIAANGVLSCDFYGNLQKPLILNAGEGLVPYFATANADNSVRVVYELPNN